MLNSLLLLSSLFASSLGQTPHIDGGGIDTLHYRFSGGNQFGGFGEQVASAGDVNGDGVVDFLFGSRGFGFYGTVSVHSGFDGSSLHEWSGAGSTTGVGRRVFGPGDINQDGLDDVLIAEDQDVVLYSGGTSQELFRWPWLPPSSSGSPSIGGGGDFNGDGVLDILIGSPDSDSPHGAKAGLLYAYSGFDGSLLHRWEGSSAYARLGSTIDFVLDVDGDGKDEVLSAEYGVVILYSGASNTRIQTWTAAPGVTSFGYDVTNLGDTNQDGVEDIAVLSRGPNVISGFDTLQVFSCSDGSQISSFQTQTGHSWGGSIAAAGDYNGDGRQDFFAISFDENWVEIPKLYSGLDGSVFFQYPVRVDNWANLAALGDLSGDGETTIVLGGQLVASSSTGQGRNAALVLSFTPCSKLDQSSVSASAGGVATMSLDFPNSLAFYRYKILMSAGGTGSTLMGVPIPLTQDRLFLKTYAGHYPFQIYSGAQGTLDASGQAVATFTVLPGTIPSAAIGRILHFAAVAHRAGRLPEFSSIALPYVITP